MALITDAVSYWKLDEASSSDNAADAHGSNILSQTNTPGTASGKLGGARDFINTSSERFSLADNTSLSTGDVDFFVSLWVQLDSSSASTYRVPCAKANTGQMEWYLWYDGAVSRLKFRVSPNGTTDSSANEVTASSFGALTADGTTWYHLQAWHDAGNNQLGISINNTENTVSYTSGVFDGTAAFVIGNMETLLADSNAYWDGRIDSVYFRKGSIPTSGERAELYNSGTGLEYPFTSAAAPRRLLLLGVGA